MKGPLNPDGDVTLYSHCTLIDLGPRYSNLVSLNQRTSIPTVTAMSFMMTKVQKPLQTVATTTPTHCHLRSSVPPPMMRPSSPPPDTRLSANTPTRMLPTMPGAPWREVTSRTSSRRSVFLNSQMLPKEASPPMIPMTKAAQGEMNPEAGVTAARPANAPLRSSPRWNFLSWQ